MSAGYPEIVLQTKSEIKKHFKFEPQEDITAWESAKIAELFVYITASSSPTDWESFVYDNHLQRHFIDYIEPKE